MKKYRNEWKYCLSEGKIELLSSRLKNALEIDSHTGDSGKYAVHSLYFDDYYNTCAKETEAGLEKRYKWRIRYYDNESNKIFLEKKEKLQSRTHKKSCEITVDEFKYLISDNISELLWRTDKKLLKEFCVKIMTKRFMPKLIIDYERTAFVEPISNIRITIDTNISASNEVDRFLKNDYQRYPLQNVHCHILEVKFDEILPAYIRNLVGSDNFVQTSFSKYYLGRKRIEEIVV